MPQLPSPCPPGSHEIQTRKHLGSLPTVAGEQVHEAHPGGPHRRLQEPTAWTHGARVRPSLTGVGHTCSHGVPLIPRGTPDLCGPSSINHLVFRPWPGWACAQTSSTPASLTDTSVRTEEATVIIIAEDDTEAGSLRPHTCHPGSPHSGDHQLASLQPRPSV